MRYPRNAKIFRGQIDAAPFAGLFFLLVLMLFIFSTHVFVPGIQVRLDELEPAAGIPGRILTVEGPEGILYKGERHDLASFDALLRREAKAGTAPRRLVLLTDPKVHPEILEKVENLALELGIRLRPPSGRLELPEDAGYPGTPGPAVVIGVNLNGQLFYQHQVIQPDALERQLRQLRREQGRVAVVVQADRKVPLEDALKAGQIARAAGVSEITFVTKPPRPPSRREE